MKDKVFSKISLILSIVLTVLFLYSSCMKFSPTKEVLAQASAIGLDKRIYFYLGIIELLSVILFLIPRTAVLGSMLLIAYLGGAIAAHLVHGQSILFPLFAQVLLFMATLFRFFEIKKALLNQNP